MHINKATYTYVYVCMHIYKTAKINVNNTLVRWIVQNMSKLMTTPAVYHEANNILRATETRNLLFYLFAEIIYILIIYTK